MVALRDPDLVDVAEAGGDVDADLERRVLRPVILDLEPIVEPGLSAVEGTGPTGSEDVLADRLVGGGGGDPGAS